MKRRSPAGDGYVSCEEAARQGGYRASYLCELARTGRLPARRVKNKWFIDQQALEARLINRETRPKRGRPRVD
jgi:hypothetical protein